MKISLIKKTFLFLLLITSQVIFSQDFSLAELIKTSEMNADEFDTYVIAKGYIFYKTESDDYSSGVRYSHNRNRNGQADKFIISYTVKENQTKMVSFQTAELNEYLAIKNQIKLYDFEFINSDVTESKSSIIIYRNKIFQLALLSIESTNDIDEKMTTYEIGLVKI